MQRPEPCWTSANYFDGNQSILSCQDCGGHIRCMAVCTQISHRIYTGRQGLWWLGWPAIIYVLLFQLPHFIWIIRWGFCCMRYRLVIIIAYHKAGLFKAAIWSFCMRTLHAWEQSITSQLGQFQARWRRWSRLKDQIELTRGMGITSDWDSCHVLRCISGSVYGASWKAAGQEVESSSCVNTRIGSIRHKRLLNNWTVYTWGEQYSS